MRDHSIHSLQAKWETPLEICSHTGRCDHLFVNLYCVHTCHVNLCFRLRLVDDLCSRIHFSHDVLSVRRKLCKYQCNINFQFFPIIVVDSCACIVTRIHELFRSKEGVKYRKLNNKELTHRSLQIVDLQERTIIMNEAP